MRLAVVVIETLLLYEYTLLKHKWNSQILQSFTHLFKKKGHCVHQLITNLVCPLPVVDFTEM